MYKGSSGFVHLSLDSLPDTYGMLRTDYGFFMNADYIENEFRSQLQLLWETIDVTLCTILFVESWFYEYGTVKDCLDSIRHSPSSGYINKLIKLIKKQSTNANMQIFLQLSEGKRSIMIQSTNDQNILPILNLYYN